MASIPETPASKAQMCAVVAMKANGDVMSELRKAVTALKVGTNSPPKHNQSPKTAAIKVPDGTDSGYVSNNTSQRSTPDSTPDASAKAVYVDGVLVGSSWALRPKKFKLQLFDNDSIPQPTCDRFNNLKEQYKDALFEYIRAAPNPRKVRNIGMTLEVLGETKETAIPWVLLQCRKGVAKKVRGFFKQPHVEAEYKPAQPTTHKPYLPILVHEEEPDKLARNSLLEPSSYKDYPEAAGMTVYGDTSSMVDTLCGSEIEALTLGVKSTATIGGLVTMVDAEGKRSMYALTAGHFLDPESGEEEDADDEDDADDDDDDESNEFSFDHNDLYELDLCSVEPKSAGRGIFFDKAGDFAQPTEVPESCSEIGHVFKASHDDLQDLPNLDWALIDISDKGLYLPNIVSSHEVSPIVSDPSVGSKANVILTTATRGSLTGTLSKIWSYLALSPGNSMARMYLLTLSDNKVFQHGDSGAWVIDASTSEVYGHVVASDAFGRAYVVPLSDIFADIRSRLSSKTVELPFRHQLSTFNPEVRFSKSFSPRINHDSNPFKPDQISFPDYDLEGINIDAEFNFDDIAFSAMNFSGYPDMQHPAPYFNDSGISLDAGIDFDLYSNATSHSYYQGYQSLAMCPLNADAMSTERSGGSNDSGYVSMNNSPVPAPDTMAFVRDDCPPATSGPAPDDLQQAATIPIGLTPEEIAMFTTIDAANDFDYALWEVGSQRGAGE